MKKVVYNLQAEVSPAMVDTILLTNNQSQAKVTCLNLFEDIVVFTWLTVWRFECVMGVMTGY